MGEDENAEPFFFCKSSDTVLPCIGPSTIPFPRATQNLHHEVELVVAIGKSGVDVNLKQAAEMITGYAVGIDLTRRDLQDEAKQLRRPWSTAKSFSNAAPVSALRPFNELGLLTTGTLGLTVNGQLRQSGKLEHMIHSVTQLISRISQFDRLEPGDLIFTGTPSGVGPIHPGDRLRAEITGLSPILIDIEPV
jgi:fumarylpyruvate hydrolase